MCRVVAVRVNLLFLSGNLYSRHIQIDGEMLAIQVQDTPGVQVSSMQPCSSPKQLYICECVCPSVHHLVMVRSRVWCPVWGEVVNCVLTSEATCVECLWYASSKMKQFTVLVNHLYAGGPLLLSG